MRGWIFLLAGVATAAGLVMVSRAQGGVRGAGRGAKVDDLAAKLQGAWADHHTVA